MPSVAKFPNGLKIKQYYKDHDPPHFHVESPGAEALIRIADLDVEAGQISNADHALVKTWGINHQAELAFNWVLAQAGLPIRKIGHP